MTIECRVVCSEKIIGEYATRYKFRGVQPKKKGEVDARGFQQWIEDHDHPNWQFWKASPSINFEISVDQKETTAEYFVGHEYQVLMLDLGQVEQGV